MRKLIFATTVMIFLSLYSAACTRVGAGYVGIKVNQAGSQKKEVELLQSQADAAKMVAEADGVAQSILKKAEAEAKANNLVNNSLTTTLIDYERTKRWNGVLPQVTGGAVPFVNLK